MSTDGITTHVLFIVKKIIEKNVKKYSPRNFPPHQLIIWVAISGVRLYTVISKQVRSKAVGRFKC